MVQFRITDHRYDRSVGHDIEYQGIERDICMMSRLQRKGMSDAGM